MGVLFQVLGADPAPANAFSFDKTVGQNARDKHDVFCSRSELFDDYSSLLSQRPKPTPIMQAQVQPPVKQGAVIGGWVCFFLGLTTMFLSL